MVIVKEPGVDVPLAQRGLYGGKIHGQTTILNNEGDLSELRQAQTVPGETAAPVVRLSETRQKLSADWRIKEP